MSKPYRLATNEEKDCCYEYDMLVGPNGFECTLTEAEDRIWLRDGKDVVNELNRLYEENLELKRQIDVIMFSK